MADRTPAPTPAAGGVSKRRVLIAGAGAAFAATLAKMATPGTVSAADGNPIIAGANTSSTNQTTISNNGSTPGAYALLVTSTGQTAIRADSPGNQGLQATTSSSFAIWGLATNGLGTATGQGIHANADTGIGIEANSNGPGNPTIKTVNTNGGLAIQAVSQAGAGGGPAIQAESKQFAAVQGRATTGGQGVYGLANTGFAVWGQSSGAGSIAGIFENATSGDGVRGTSVGGTGVHGISSGTGGNAGVFDGNVQVNGNFQATGTKSAAVPYPVDGSLRLVYATESPECWLEDFGMGTLSGGRAEVRIATDFLPIIDTANAYHVFVTPHTADVESLAVTSRGANSFVVEANGKGRVEGTFSYRIVARRKDNPGVRLAITTHPAIQDTKSTPAPVFLPNIPTPMPPLPKPIV